MSDAAPDGDRHRRRQRRRATAPQGPPPEPAAAHREPAGKPTAKPARADRTDKPRPSRRAAREGGADRGLRDLVGAGHSMLGVSGALRGRDVNRPTEADLAAAEQEVEIVRRNWKPRDGD